MDLLVVDQNMQATKFLGLPEPKVKMALINYAEFTLFSKF